MALTTIEASLKYSVQHPLASSREKQWGDALTADAYSGNRSFYVEAPALDHHFISCVYGGAGRLQQVVDERRHSAVIHTNEVIVLPSRRSAIWSGTTPQHVRLRISETALSQAWQQLGALPGGEVELLASYAKPDLLLCNIARIFLYEMRQPQHPAQRMIAEAATCVVTAHLVRNNCSFHAKPEPVRTSICSAVLNRIDAYVRDNLADPICLKDLAELSGLSVYYFCRVFHRSVGVSPMRYVETLRIAAATDLIRRGNRSLGRVARQVGFEDQSHFSRRFALHMRCSPSVFAKSLSTKPLE